MYGKFCIEYIDFLFKGKIVTEFTNFFSPYDFEKNDKIFLIIFENKI